MPGSQRQLRNMPERNLFINQYQRQSQRLDQLLPWMQQARAESRQQILAQGPPVQNSEYWKYCRVDDFLFTSSDTQENASPDATVQSETEGYTRAWDIETAINVGIPGTVFSPKKPGALPEGLTISQFSDGDTDSMAILNRYFNQNLSDLAPQAKYRLSSINTSMLSDGLLIHVKKGVTISPILNLQIQPKGYQRLLVVLEPGSSLRIVEQIPADHDENGHLNYTVECVLEPDSKLQHSRIQGKSNTSEYTLTTTQLGHRAD